jgi:hypothetical protein
VHLKRPSGENHRDWMVLPDPLGNKAKDREKEEERGTDKDSEGREYLWTEKDNSSKLTVTRMICASIQAILCL